MASTDKNKKMQDKVAKVLDAYDKKHGRNLNRTRKVLDKIYDMVAKEAARIGLGTQFNDPEAPFHIDDYPVAKKQIDALILDMGERLTNSILESEEREWKLSNAKNAAMLVEYAKAADVPADLLEAWNEPHKKALEAFKTRKIGNGEGLSDKVWKVGQQARQELELALDVGLGDGKSAAELSRDVRKYLQDPNKLFRRVRDKHGNLRLSKAAEAYHPGRGRYRSSYKNAIRMTATETNMAYRTADHLAWQDNELVIGQKVQLSNNHTLNGRPFFDICNELAGEYPKDFVFKGWHPLCRCIVTPIIAEWDEYMKKAEMEIDGKDVSDYHYEGEVTEMPDNFTAWVEKNQERISAAKVKPYFIEDNFVDGDTSKGYVWKQQTETVKEPVAIKAEPNVVRDIADDSRYGSASWLKEEPKITQSNLAEESADTTNIPDPVQRKHPTKKEVEEAGGIDAYTQQSCNVSLAEAKRMNEAVHRYSLDKDTGWDADVRAWQMRGEEAKLKNPVADVIETAEQCERFIELSPKWEGRKTFRGMSLSNEVVDGWIAKAGTDEAITMRGTSSWSTSENIGKEFAAKFISEITPRKVLVICQGKQNGTSIKHIAKYPKEREVLCSMDGKWKIEKHSVKDGMDVFIVRSVF